MKDTHVTDLLSDYLDGTLSSPQSEEVELHLMHCPGCQTELEELRLLFEAFRTEERSLPSAELSSGFYQMLAREKEKSREVVAPNTKNRRLARFLKIAAGIALLIGSFALGRMQQQQESKNAIAAVETRNLEIKQTAMLSLMENTSASRRIQGVNYIDEFTDPDEAIVSALADRMLHDENTNVRLAAVEALGGFTSSDIVKNAFITALRAEKDPSIQITLIQTLVELREKEAIVPMQMLLKQDETQPFVKRQIESLLPNIL
jgi:hypothetical protein